MANNDKNNAKLDLQDSKSMNNINKNKDVSINNNLLKNQNILTDKNIFNNNNFIELNDYELNNLTYNEALTFDKRNFIKYYFSLLKTKHIIIFTFYTKNDYNSKIIKIVIFVLFFSLNLTINALFFNDDTMHKIYEDEGNFNFIYQIPQIIYSTIISSLIQILIKYLSLTEKKILEIKNEKKNQNISKILHNLVIKFIIFFVLVYIFLILFWYYLSCFCAVYRNTQTHLIKDTLITFCLSLLYPFGLNLLPGVLRIISLNNKKGEFLYNISKLIQLI